MSKGEKLACISFSRTQIKAWYTGYKETWKEEQTCLWGTSIFTCLEPVLMNHPFGLPPIRRPSSIEDQGLSHPYYPILGEHHFVSTSCLPKPCSCCSICSCSCWILLVFVTEKVPLISLLLKTKIAPGCMCTIYLYICINKKHANQYVIAYPIGYC